MEFRVLGPLEVRDRGQALPLGPLRVRTVCGILLARPGNLVPTEQFVDELWPDQPPPDARALVRGYLSRLRGVLRRCPSGPVGADLLITRKPGYLLRVDDRDLDRYRFDRLVAEARAVRQAGQLGRCVELYEQAHRLWRGDPFTDLPATASIAAAATWLTERRLVAMEEQFDAILETGCGVDVVTELTELVRAHPLRERLVRQLMLALYRGGRQAEALEHYQRMRRALADELGVDPGPELQQLHVRILNADPVLRPPGEGAGAAAAVTAGITPRQLPLDIATFVGRCDELTTLCGLLRVHEVGGRSRIVVIHGAPGAGKSALAVRAANLCAGSFPDGQLYVNLRGSTPHAEPLGAGDALGGFLRALGIPASGVPHDVEERAALFRTLVADRRMLVLLDNAATVGQLRPLLPGSLGSAVLVTSRASMNILEGAVHVSLAPLDAAASRAMLDRLVADARTAGDPRGALGRLAELCDHLPLGLHLAAARLKARPGWSVQQLVERLTDERDRLTELAAGDLAVRSSLGVSHAVLRDSDDPDDRAAARGLAMLGLLRVTDIDLGAAAVLFDSPVPATDRAIERLLDAHLVEEATPGRYHMHDLVRLFAHELAAERLPADEADAALTRVLSYYLGTVQRANDLVYPHRAHYPVPDVAAVPGRLSGRDEARGWLEAERGNMLALVRQALPGAPEHARLGAGLTLALHWFFVHGGYIDARTSLGEQSLAVAVRLGDRATQAYLNGFLAWSAVMTGRPDVGRAHILAELSLCRQIGDRFGEQRALGNLGHVHLIAGQPEQALPYLSRQLEVAREIGAGIGEAYALVSLGKAHHRLGRPDEAVRLIRLALDWYESVGDDFRCGALEELGRVYIALGRLEQAVAVLTRSLECARRIDYRLGEIWALGCLARAWRLRGALDKALTYAEEAVALSEVLDGTRARSEALAEHAEVMAAHRSVEGAALGRAR